MLWTAMRGAAASADCKAAPLHFPPLRPFLAARTQSLPAVRDLANNLFKNNIAFCDLAMDLIDLHGERAGKAANNAGLVADLADLEHQYQARKKGHDAIYYELALHTALNASKK